MTWFVSAGEPSGDLHLANLALALKQLHPQINLTGFGGPRAAAAGVTLRFELANFPIMGVSGMVQHLPTFFRLARQTEHFFHQSRPEALILIDYPGFHFALGHRAKRAGVPVYYYVPPQLWAWRGYRVRELRRWCTAVLTALPFEETWYRERGVRTHNVGHPYFDELATRSWDRSWVMEQRSRGGPIVALLPGSRSGEVHANFPLMLRVAQELKARQPGIRFLTAAFKESQAQAAAEYARAVGLDAGIHTGKMPEILEASEVVLAVSGSVSLELLAHRKPAVILYRVPRWLGTVVRPFIQVPYMSLVNLLANRVIYPEFPLLSDDIRGLSEPLLTWLSDPQSREATIAELTQLGQAVIQPGASRRAAEFLTADVASQVRSA